MVSAEKVETSSTSICNLLFFIELLYKTYLLGLIILYSYVLLYLNLTYYNPTSGFSTIVYYCYGT